MLSTIEINENGLHHVDVEMLIYIDYTSPMQVTNSTSTKQLLHNLTTFNKPELTNFQQYIPEVVY